MEKPVSKLKLILAAVGVVYLVAAGAWGAHWMWQRRAVDRPPNLAAMPGFAKDILVNRELSKISGQLDLDREQEKQVREIIRESGIVDAPPREMIGKYQAVRERVRGVLRPDQADKMAALEQERVAQMSDRLVGVVRGQLELTAEQEEKVRAIVAEYNPLRNPPQPGQAPGVRLAEARARIRTLLTPEQQEKMDRMPALADRFGGAGQTAPQPGEK